ncbi:MAG: hypothetical protein GXP24_12860 [Planctomycetes bacterium]|nr:hypothetical protein [Planctomycetota bacterium]
MGKQRYPDATSILWTCDGGGSNSSRKTIFKYDLERLSESIGLPIRVAHYPPYCSHGVLIERGKPMLIDSHTIQSRKYYQ